MLHSSASKLPFLGTDEMEKQRESAAPDGEVSLRAPLTSLLGTLIEGTLKSWGLKVVYENGTRVDENTFYLIAASLMRKGVRT